ncbi:MAG: D-2-hydroxyacid dehydrogenase [Clostridium sp.]|nr:D-2-hydroxyacid dehydrogenase [Clostridium sp.]MCM1208844.1 D-2-hydroxyacid dehydrogenase [Ruminococcus sp.]
MKIVVLDYETITRDGDVSLKEIASLGELVVFGFTPDEMVAERIGDAEVVLCNKSPITEAVFAACPQLQYVGLFATGYNNVDIEAAKRHGITVCNVPAYSANSVAQHTFALILNHFNKIREYADLVDNGVWIKDKVFNRFYIPTYELTDMTIGIIGYGDIGRRVAELSTAFGMKVLAYTRSPEKIKPPVTAASLSDLLKNSDIVTIHCPLTDATKEMINKDTIAMMKKTAYFVNTARGGIMNEQHLADALNNDMIAGAGIDVLTLEPMREDCPLKNAKNCTLTPHVAWAPKQTRENLFAVVADNLFKWTTGQPQNVVNNSL